MTKQDVKNAMDMFNKVGPEAMTAFVRGTVPVGEICKHCKANIHQTPAGKWIGSGGLNWALCEKHEPDELAQAIAILRDIPRGAVSAETDARINAFLDSVAPKVV